MCAYIRSTRTELIRLNRSSCDPITCPLVQSPSVISIEIPCGKSSDEELYQCLEQCGFLLTEDLVLNVLRRHRSDWRPAYVFFNWVCERGETASGFSPGSGVFMKFLTFWGK
ncbi:hypothetical protein RJ641_000167 [Dillenia turbinata]|uniref:Uncharacterized protein n=1 Tax=Dillenia turbinata TaxID=194707 RepID=A0AAN8ZM48_9MAGN